MSHKKNYILFAIFTAFFIGGCNSDDPNNINPEISFEQTVIESDELSQITIVANATDIDGSIMSYEWTQVSGTVATLSRENTNTLSVLLPDVTKDENLVFSLIVTDNDGAITSRELSILVNSSLADKNPINSLQITENDRNSSVFISALDIEFNPSLLSQISFMIIPRENSVAEPLKVTFGIDKLTLTNNGINLPVFGLYSDYENNVELVFHYIDNSKQTLQIDLNTGPYIDTRSVHDNVQIVKAPETALKPSYSYFLLKSAANGPVIMDIDGNTRWVSSDIYDSSNSTYLNGVVYVTSGNLFIINDLSDTKLQTVMSQSQEFSDLSNIDTHHNIDLGKFGLLVQINADKEGSNDRRIESILWETDYFGNVIKEWDFGEIIETHMIENGDNPENFVRNGVDWCHMNSATYDSTDDSIIVSCRENFVIKVDYETGDIKWLLGDETKYWYSFDSLKELSLFSLDTKPIGQHSLSVINNELMLFNNGLFSFNSPAGESKGLSLASSRPSRYSIDTENKTAALTWEYDPGLYSDVCSSIYRDANIDGDYLINFAAINRTNGQTKKIIVQGLDEEQQLLFEFHLFSPEPPCLTAWNAEPISDLTDLTIN